MLERFKSLATAAPDAPALIQGSTGHVTTRRQLLDRASALADDFRRSGISTGDVIAVQLPNSADFVAAWLAALTLRVVVVPIDRDAAATEVEAILSHFDARALIGPTISTRSAGTPAVLPPEACLIKLTSGSTGKPKGIVTSAANLLGDFESIAASMDIGPDDLNLGAIPFSHSYGFSNLITPLIVQGTAVVISNDYLPQATLDLANRYGCTVVPGIPM
ncbi:MAG: class I adenylate-forming enzyme family protein, partial [Thermoanaerobaculia bacterium]